MKQLKRLSVVLALCLLVVACEGEQSALAPAGPVAREISGLWWAMAAGAVVIFVAVVVLLLVATLRHPDRKPPVDLMQLIYAGGIVIPVVVLSILMIFGIRVGSGATAAAPEGAIRIHITGHQFWWDIEYDFGEPSTRFSTANEIYVPTGEPVELLLTSRDVIHSLWVPKLSGKIDLIPGRTNRLLLEADTEGIFRGQCAEYCGVAHTQMALHVIAIAPESFATWVEQRRAPAARFPRGRAADGAALFQATGCGLCHTVRGTGAWGRAGPDLTHFGARPTLGAGTLLNTRENVAYWIAHNDAVKPRNRMPEYNDLPLEVRITIAEYLETLR